MYKENVQAPEFSNETPINLNCQMVVAKGGHNIRNQGLSIYLNPEHDSKHSFCGFTGKSVNALDTNGMAVDTRRNPAPFTVSQPISITNNFGRS